ncbi:hypothetical protein HK405_002599, partial [Cladochytrium tenue]
GTLGSSGGTNGDSTATAKPDDAVFDIIQAGGRNTAAFDPAFDDVAVAVKTGGEVAAARVPAQLVTFLRAVRNVMLLGDMPGLRVGDVEVGDVCSGTYEAAAARLAEAAPVDGDDDGSGLERRDAAAVAAALAAATAAAGRVQADEGSSGWQADAQKNLPGIRELYRRFPSAAWYLMVDDDSYVSMANLVAGLSQRGDGRREAVYQGLPNVFRGCDGVREFGGGPQFAHGGSGIVLSRAAVERLLPYIDGCIVKYSDCW